MPSPEQTGQGTTVEQAQANIMGLLQQQQDLLESVNAMAQGMQDPRLNMQADSQALERRVNDLGTKTNQQVNDLNMKAAAGQKKKGITALAVSVIAGAAGVALMRLGVKDKGKMLKRSAMSAAGLGGTLLGGGLAAKLLSGNKENLQFVNEMAASLTSANQELDTLYQTYDQKIKLKLSQMPPGAVESALQSPPQPTAGMNNPAPATQQPANAGMNAANMVTPPIQPPAPMPAASAPPLTKLSDATEAQPHREPMAVGMGAPS